jgi:hypothetical protein
MSNFKKTAGVLLAEKLGITIIGTEGHDLKTACVSCPSSDAGRVHSETGVYYCFSCGVKHSPFSLCEKVLNNREEAKRIMIEVGLFNDRPQSNGTNDGKTTADGHKITAQHNEEYQNAKSAIIKAAASLLKKFGKPVATWTYHNAQGEPVGVIFRWDTPTGKEIRPVSKIDGRWVLKGMPEPRPLYCLPVLAEAPRVYVTEGEKAADAARSIGMTATTSPHGSKSAGKADWTPLAGKDIIILPDNDKPGKDYCEVVQAALAKLTPAPAVKVVNLPGLPAAGDMVDWIDAHGDTAEPEEMRRQVEVLVEATTETKLVAVNPAVSVTVAPGTRIKAADRNNFGTVLADHGQSCLVRFVSPADGSTADVELPKSQLSTPEGKPLTAAGEPTEPPAFTNTYTTDEFLGLDLSTEYLIDHVLVGGQQCGMGGRSKTLKTYVALDAAISLGSGTMFLDRFNAKQVNVGFWSGESGAATIRRNALQIASSREIDLRSCSIDWGFDLPKLSKPAHLAALQEVITAKKLDVVFIDPLYLSLLSAETAGRPGDLFFMGSILEPLTALMQTTGVTIVLLHHFRKNGFVDDKEPAGIEEFSMSGIAEWCRQWILLQRRNPYQSDGRHELWMRTGGSAGHSGLWSLDVDEGTPDARKWEVSVQPVSNVREEAKRQQEQKRAEEREATEAEHRRRLLDVLTNHPSGETARKLRTECGLNPVNFGKAITTLLKEGRAESCEIEKKGGPYEGYKPTHK